MVLVVLLGVSFSFDYFNTFAAVKKASSKLSTSKSKNKTKSTKAKKITAKAKVKTAKVKSKKVTSKKKATKESKSKKKTKKLKNKGKKIARGRVHSRGSGSTLGDGSVVKVINYAKKYLGVNYNFGSSSASAFDCSGFIMYVYRVAGVDLPHSAAGQANLGLAIQNKSDLSPGDLVFFETTRPGISHVGMYIGNDHFIHASSGAGEVTITSLSDQYYSSRFRGGTRILND
jgi:cell wall-associated NlpC family hydrolase